MKVAIVVVGLGLLLWYFSKVGPSATSPVVSRQPIYDHKLGVFNPILSIPGAGTAYNILAPINSGIIQPTVNELNKVISSRVNQLPGLSDAPVVTTNADGTITRTADKSNWYVRNIGSPVSSFVSSLW